MSQTINQNSGQEEMAGKVVQPDNHLLDKGEKGKIRQTMFQHLNGLVVGPTFWAMLTKGVFRLFDSGRPVQLAEICRTFKGNSGYLNVALRLLVCLGWLKQKRGEEPLFSLTPQGSIAVELGVNYGNAVRFLPISVDIDSLLWGQRNQANPEGLVAFCCLVELCERGWDMGKEEDLKRQQVSEQIRLHLDGLLIGPIMVSLARRGGLSLFEGNWGAVDNADTEGTRGYINASFELMAALGWAEWKEGGMRLTAEGAYAESKAFMYGITVSYLRTLVQVDDLLFGNPNCLWRESTSGGETHVDRSLNVWSSGCAHRTYFTQADSIVLDIFNRPLDEQPAGVIDVGCGDGTFLKHIYELVKGNTPRGAVLEQHPLLMIGVDFNQAARESTEINLNMADIPHIVLFGDVNDPEAIATSLRVKHGIRMKELLGVRAFLDHDRTYFHPDNEAPMHLPVSTGAFSSKGELIDPHKLVQNLVEHFQRWTPFISEYGLLVLELHAISPELTAANIGKTLAMPFETIHGYTDQYPVELSVFFGAIRAAGLEADSRFQFKFPPSELATISLNIFRPMGLNVYSSGE
jgi:hypothetical protein